MLQRFPGSLRFRFLAALGGVLLLALVALWAMSKWVIFPALNEEEHMVVNQEIGRIERSLKLSEKELLAQARDWAIWDDTYEFVQGNYPAYADTNFSQQMFEEMRYQLMAFFNSAGEVYFLAGINPATGRYDICYTAERDCRWMAGLIRNMQKSIEQDPLQGKTELYAGSPPMMVASNPILRTDESGIPQGWLFKVRSMDENWLATIEDYTGLAATLSMVNPDVVEGSTFDIVGNTIFAQRFLTTYPLNEQIVLGTQLTRTSYLASLDTFRYVLIWTASLMLVVIGLVLLLLEKIILRPLRALTLFTQQISNELSMSTNLTKRSDEIGLLARAFCQQIKRQQQLTDELTELSTLDPLTGLPNRRLFDKRLQEAVDQALTNDLPLSVMMIDIDHFKLYNDYYGHSEGDACLRWIALTMNDVATAHSFFIARTGGEEFSALLPAASTALAIEKSHALSQAIKHLDIPHHVSPVSHLVTISIGISQLDSDSCVTTGALMTAADQALYAAKAAGRDCAMVYTPALAKATFSSNSTLP